MNTPREWEEELDKIWWDLSAGYRKTSADKLLVDAWNGKRKQVKSFIRTIEDKAREEERERVRKALEKQLDTNIRVSLMEHTMGAHSDTHDPVPCYCDEEEKRIERKAYENVKKSLSDIITALNEKEV